MVETIRLESGHTLTGIVGSNPTLSAILLQLADSPYEEAHKRQRRDVRAIAGRKDEDIDFAHVPPVLNWGKAEIGKFYDSRRSP